MLLATWINIDGESYKKDDEEDENGVRNGPNG